MLGQMMTKPLKKLFINGIYGDHARCKTLGRIIQPTDLEHDLRSVWQPGHDMGPTGGTKLAGEGTVQITAGKLRWMAGDMPKALFRQQHEEIGARPAKYWHSRQWHSTLNRASPTASYRSAPQ